MKKLGTLKRFGIAYLLIAAVIAFLNRSDISWLIVTVSAVIGFIAAYIAVDIRQNHTSLLVSIIVTMAVFTVYAVLHGIFWQIYGALLIGFGAGTFLLQKGDREYWETSKTKSE